MRVFNQLFIAFLATSPLTCLAVDVAITIGFQQTEVTEIGLTDQRLNQETGKLPYVEFELSTPIKHDFILFTRHQLASGDLDYDGRLQNGLPYQTNTQTEFRQHLLGVSTPIITTLLSGEQRLFSSLAFHSWQRDIMGKSGVNSLYERYEWKNMSVGINHVSSSKDLKLSFAGYKTFDGTMNVSIPNIGEGNISLPQGSGFIAKAEYRLLQESNVRLFLGVSYDYQLISRSGAGDLYYANTKIGTITEPEHSIQKTNIYLTVAF